MILEEFIARWPQPPWFASRVSDCRNQWIGLKRIVVCDRRLNPTDMIIIDTEVNWIHWFFLSYLPDDQTCYQAACALRDLIAQAPTASLLMRHGSHEHHGRIIKDGTEGKRKPKRVTIIQIA